MNARRVSPLGSALGGTFTGRLQWRNGLKKEGEKQKWGQTRRLAFIEMRTQYEGRINRGDLVKFFGISTPQASADLSIYQKKAPANLI